MVSEKYAARVVIYNASDFTVQGKKDIALWLRKLAVTVMKQNKSLSKRFTAKYYYP